MHLLDLPVDILFLIIPYLDVPSFVSLTSTCKGLRDADIAEYPSFWSSAIRDTFRVPNQPVVQDDGRRWQRLYRRLLTQSRVFKWGKNNTGNGYVSWPTEMDHTPNLGIIADLQLGGWSTTLLTSQGALYSVGVLNGLLHRQQPKTRPTELRYPSNVSYPQPSERYDPTTAVKQFSVGRSHILALSDSGLIWSWNNIDQAGINVKFLNVELREEHRSAPRSLVEKVVAGWSKSAALIAGTGIVVWDVLARSHGETEIEDAALVLESATVPNTGFQRATRARGESLAQQKEDGVVGEVLNFVCLEHFVLFNTHTGKVFASKITWSDEEHSLSSIFEIPLLPAETTASSEGEQPAKKAEIEARDVQGSFRSFAIFTSTGAVLSGKQDHLEAIFSDTTAANQRPLVRVPALQHTEVISLAFGDHHMHALHAPGYITSYGNESQGCGSLGLGSKGEAHLRGIRYNAMNGDGMLVPHAYSSGRRVWFEPEKRRWIKFLLSGAKEPAEAVDSMRMCAQVAVQAEVSEWVEMEGNAWEDTYGRKPAVDEDDEDDALPAYFALSVAAAGWHSGALVLVNEDKAKRVSEGCVVRSQPEPASDSSTDTDRGFLSTAVDWVWNFARWFLGMDQTAEGQASEAVNGASTPASRGVRDAWQDDYFPRLKLTDGREMPGTAPFSEWRHGRPSWDLRTTSLT